MEKDTALGLPEGELEKLETLAIKAATEAGKVLRRDTDDLRNIKDEPGNDVKLKADMESEKLVRRLLDAESGLPVIGEEQGGDPTLPEQNQLYWVVDPLDGTYNYLRDVPTCCVSIGLWRGSKPVLGVINDFNLGETLTSVVGGGLKLNGKPHKPQWAKERRKALLTTGFPAHRDFGEEALADFIKVVQRYKKIRMIGSASLAVAYVAAGRADVYFEEAVKLWDVAAGIAMVEAVGGCYKLESVDPEGYAYNVWAAAREDFILD